MRKKIGVLVFDAYGTEIYRNQFYTLFSDEFSNLSNSQIDKLIEKFFDWNAAPLAHVLVDHERIEAIKSIQKSLPENSVADIEEALSYPAGFAARTATERASGALSQYKQSMNAEIAKLERMVSTEKQKLQNQLQGLKKLESQFTQVGLGKRVAQEEKIDLSSKCRWVPANVRHDTETHHSHMVYGGVHIEPEIRVLDEKDSSRALLVSDVFSGPAQGRADVSYVAGTVQAASQEQVGNESEKAGFLFHLRLLQACQEKLERAQQQGADIDEMIAKAKRDAAQQSNNQSTGFASSNVGKNPNPATASAGGRKPPSPPSSPPRGANKSAESKQSSSTPNPSRPPSPSSFWQQQSADIKRKSQMQTVVGYFTGSADEAYEIIRASVTDTRAIAKNTGIKESNIMKVKKHIFYEKHLLDKYVDYGIPAEMRRFDSDLAIANAWKRLEMGDFTKDDIQLLKHEIAEVWYMKKYGHGYTAAHNAASTRFPAPDLEEMMKDLESNKSFQ